ncbi:MAG TPA: hypothetical protein VM073_09685 [Usitatibacter sp.]|nr:hypothetical protein [Usitatibacter sp.]
MRRIVLAAAFSSLSLAVFASDQPALDACISSWGKAAPFKKGKPADSVIGTGVKVFGIGSGQSGSDPVTDKPVLVLVRPAVNVAGSSTIKLSNPNGWYCFRSNVTVAGAMRIEAHCKAHIASAKEDGTTVGAADESGKGVAVFGALRVNRFDCPEGKSK